MTNTAMSVKEMAKELGISVPKAYELANSEGFPSIRISEHRIIISVPGFKMWMDRQVAEKLAERYPQQK